ncbi:ATP-binding protein [Actinomadura darangshiensis]|uniref:ATP-binding protein n=1 Tax=Actinomadura darangshiensis TaxID=705336 RepID=UPI003C7D57B5
MRRAVARVADGFDLGDVDLLVCEVATNAVRHSASGQPGGGVWVTLLVSAARLRVEIQDDGDSEGRPDDPHPWVGMGRGRSRASHGAGAGRPMGRPSRRGRMPHRMVRGRPMTAVRMLCDAWATWWSGRNDQQSVRPLPREHPEVDFLFGGAVPEMRQVFEVFPGEARAWRTLAEMEDARSRIWSRQGRVWDAGLCAGRAQAYRAAAEQLENVLIDLLGLWDEYERRAGGRT